jgi:hypothetical protein
MARLSRPTPHQVLMMLGLIATLALAMPDLASGKHRRPKSRISTAEFAAGFGDPSGASNPPPPFFTSPHRFDCSWVEEEPVHDYVCTPSPTESPISEQWPTPFPLKHALNGSGNPPQAEGWGGLASPESAPNFSCTWDGAPVASDELLASHYRCTYTNPQLHTFSVAEIVSVCDEGIADCTGEVWPEPSFCDPPDPCSPPDQWPTLCDPPVPCSPLYRHGELLPRVSWYLPDTMPPDTAITAGPSGLVASREASLGFGSTENGSTFECRLDGSQWEECDPPQGYEELEDGGHSFEVRATDGASNLDATAAGRAWQIDATAPDTRILRGPRNITRDRTPSFIFVASELTATLQCSLDGRPFTGCSSPHTVRRPLSDGRHSFEVQASDLLGNADESPARRAVTVDTAGPRMNVSGRKVQLTRRGFARVRIRCPVSELSGLCAGKLTLRSAERLDAGRAVMLGTKGFRVRRGRRGIVKVKLSRQARQLVAQLERLDVRATARARDRVGNVATTRRSFVLEAPGR